MVYTYPADSDGIIRGSEMLQSFLESKGVRGNENARKTILMEEVMNDLIAHADPDSTITVRPRYILGTIVVEIASRGKEYPFGESLTPGAETDWTAGCVALNDRDAQILYGAVPLGTAIEIIP